MNCVSAKIAPNSEKNAMLMPAEAMLKRGLRKNRRFSIGSGVCSSQATNAAASTAATPKQPRMSGLVQPCAGASITPNTSVTSALIERVAPSKSNAPGLGSRLSGTSTTPASIAIAATGTLNRNTELQSKYSSSSPPTNGPRPTPIDAMPAQIPIAFARSSRGKTFAMIESVAGMISAPPTPMTARTAIRPSAESTSSTARLAPPNSARPS